MNQDETSALAEERLGDLGNDELKDRITLLFEQLPPHRQEALLEELQQIFDLCVEESEDDDEMLY